jgi:hypothetical protein
VELHCLLGVQPGLAGGDAAALRATSAALEELQQRAQAEPQALQGTWHLARLDAACSAMGGAPPENQLALPRQLGGSSLLGQKKSRL